jgi:hypothetical protein
LLAELYSVQLLVEAIPDIFKAILYMQLPAADIDCLFLSLTIYTLVARFNLPDDELSLMLQHKPPCKDKAVGGCIDINRSIRSEPNGIP